MNQLNLKLSSHTQIYSRNTAEKLIKFALLLDNDKGVNSYEKR